MKFSELVERQILKAEAEGQFDNLKGAGKPISTEHEAGSMDAIGFRIMAEAGALPREIELRKAIELQQRLLQEIEGEDERRMQVAKLNDLQLRLNIEQEARRKFLGT